MDKQQLEEAVTRLLIDVFMPEGLKKAQDGTYRLMYSGIQREATENILRLAEDFYEYNAEAKKDHDTLAEVCKMLEEAKYGGAVTREDIYVYLKENGYIE